MIECVGGVDVDLNNADIFTMLDEHSYAAFIGVLSNIYMKAHASSPFRDVAYNAAIIISKSMHTKYKGQPDISSARLLKIANEMKVPDNGINLGIFMTDGSGAFDKKSKIGLKHTVSQCWPIRTSDTKTIITANLPPKQLKSGDNKVRYFKFDDIRHAIGKNDVALIDYNTPIDSVFSSLNKSKVHICYQGGTAWLSVAMGIPTIIVHPTNINNHLHLKTKLFGQDLGNINILENNLITHIRVHPAEHHTHISKLKNILSRFV